MPGSMAAIKRRLRHLGNVNKVDASHPQGNKSTMAPGEYGRAAHSQFQSGGKNQTTYQEGANFGSVSGEGSSVSKSRANALTGYRSNTIDQLENRGRNRSPVP